MFAWPPSIFHMLISGLKIKTNQYQEQLQIEAKLFDGGKKVDDPESQLKMGWCQHDRFLSYSTYNSPEFGT